MYTILTKNLFCVLRNFSQVFMIRTPVLFFIHVIYVREKYNINSSEILELASEH